MCCLLNTHTVKNARHEGAHDPNKIDSYHYLLPFTHNIELDIILVCMQALSEEKTLHNISSRCTHNAITHCWVHILYMQEHALF